MVSLLPYKTLKINKNKISYVFNGRDSNDLRLDTIEKILNESIFEKEGKISFKDFVLKAETNEEEVLNLKIKNFDIKEKIVLNSIKNLQNNLENENWEQNIILFKNNLNINNDKEINIYNKMFNAINFVVHKTLHRKKMVNNKKIKECSYFNDLNNNRQLKELIEGEDIKYNEIDKFISKLSEKNKNFEFFSIKSIILSTIYLMSELNENYTKKKDEEEINIFEYIYNDFVLKSNLCSSELEEYFISSFNSFRTKYQINFTLSELFTDIFWNSIFHNEIFFNLFINSFLDEDIDEEKKILLKRILKTIYNVNIPFKKQIVELLDIYKIEEKNDLMAIITNKKNKFHNEIVNSEIEKENSNKVNIEEKKENDENIDDTNINTSKNDNNIKYNIITANDISIIKYKKQKINDINNKEIKSEREKEEEKEANNKSIKNNNENNLDLEHKSVEEIYNYINENKIIKNKKKKRSRKNKKAKLKEENTEENINENNIEDKIVTQFKEDLNGKLFHAGCIRKIKPVLSEEWIKNISSYD